MLLNEQVRIIKDEATLVTTPVYYGPDDVYDWTTVGTAEITLDSAKIIYLKFTVTAEGYAVGNGRVLLNNTPLTASGTVGTGSGQGVSYTTTLYLLLPSGTHTFTFQLCQYYRDPNQAARRMRISGAIYQLNFPDKYVQSYSSGTKNASGNSTTTVINQQFTVPATRKLAVGYIKQYTCFIHVYMEGINIRKSLVANPGGDTSNCLNWKLYFDNVQKSWNVRNSDFSSTVTGYLDYGEGSYGLYIVPVDASNTYTLRIDVRNTMTTSYQVRAFVVMVFCPWIIPSTSYQPIKLDFPQGSTIYVTLEPLDLNPTKTVKIGKARFISFGDATDYYYTTSGTDILTASYTFETVEVSNCIMLVSGYGGCISIIGVDVR